MGGLRELYHAYGEERDLALRIHQTGLSIRYLSTEPIVHMRSPQRNTSVLTGYPVRNTILFDFLNVPFPDLIPQVISDALKLVAYKSRFGLHSSESDMFDRALQPECVHGGSVSRSVAGCTRAWRSLPPPPIEFMADDAIPAAVKDGEDGLRSRRHAAV